MNENVNPVIIKKPDTGMTDSELDKFIKFGVLEKEVDVTEGFKVTLHPLSQEEHEELTKSIVIPKTDINDTLFSRLEMFKLPSLVLAITKINSQDFNTAELKQELRQKLLKAPNVLIDKLWLAYNSLCKDQMDMLNGGLKKN